MHNKLKELEINYLFNIAILALLVLVLLAVVVGVIYIQQALRKIPIQYAKRVAGNSYLKLVAQSTHLPLKVNAAGVIPVIFALAFLDHTTNSSNILWSK